MNCVLFAKMETNTGKVREFCEAGKVGTMILSTI